MEPRKGNYLIRRSYREALHHQFDDIKNTGFNWRDNSFKRSLSSYLLNDPKREEVIGRFQVFIAYIMDYASNIKKAFNYTVDKNYKNLN